MKVIFKVIKTESGNDIYFERLSAALKKVNIDSVIEYYPKYFQFFPWLLPFFNKKTPGDIIHTNVEYGWAFREKSKPLVVSLLHNVLEQKFQKYTTFIQRIYYHLILSPNIRKSLKIANKFIAISNYTKDSFINYFGTSNIEVIYPSIDTEKYRPKLVKSNDKRFKLLFVGNLIKRKGADLLPKIMSKLGKDYVLYYTTGLRTKIPKEFNQPNMIPLGKLTEKQLIEEYNKCDALLFPSRLEGFGYAVAEAMSCGKIIIASDNSSIQELVTNGKNGYLCQTNNVAIFVKKIKSLSKKEFLQNGNSQKSRKKIVTNFNLSNISRKYLNSYLQLQIKI